MSFSKFFPVAAGTGLLAAMWVVVGLKLEYVLWVPFLSWALVFGAGAGKLSRVPKEVIGLTGGTIAAVLLILALPFATSIVGEFWGLPVLVFLAGTIIVLLELTNLFELAPAYFYSFAGFFAYLFGGFSGVIVPTVSNVAMFWILLLVGTGLGVATVMLRKFLFDLMKVPEDQRQTVFDKERKQMPVS